MNPIHPTILQKQKELFLDQLARTGNVTSAALMAGWKYPTIADMHREEDPDFAYAWIDAKRRANHALEAEARRRAVEGVKEPVFHKGEIVGSVTKYSDKMLELVLKAEMPEKYKDAQLGDSTSSGVLVVPRSNRNADNEVDITEWEKYASAQQTKLLERTE